MSTNGWAPWNCLIALHFQFLPIDIFYWGERCVSTGSQSNDGTCIHWSSMLAPIFRIIRQQPTPRSTPVTLTNRPMRRMTVGVSIGLLCYTNWSDFSFRMWGFSFRLQKAKLSDVRRRFLETSKNRVKTTTSASKHPAAMTRGKQVPRIMEIEWIMTRIEVIFTIHFCPFRFKT